MPTLRRYLRVSKYTVLECRIYLDNPSDQSWLTSPRTGALERIFASIKQLVLPKLAEERDGNGSGRGSRKKGAGVRDVVVEEEFEVAVFLTRSGTRHAVLQRNKVLLQTLPVISSNASKLTAPVVIREESEEPPQGIPEDVPEAENSAPAASSTSGREREAEAEAAESPLFAPVATDDEEDEEEDDEEEYVPRGRKRKRRQREKEEVVEVSSDDELFDEPRGERDDKKKMAFRTEYDGFAIHGLVLCLVVKRKDAKGKGKEKEKEKEKEKAPAGDARGMMEGWIQMSQAVREGEVEE